ncbi:cytidine deaminase-like protein [Calocera viscosa TUFC12733]|uniref:Cytidine deaminase-like protein n=1 Tax=Calocera viscosa (strain TUFC12733) TaxID=1330018 RepID=A0A167PUY6_CALVF|nr:cytidine deaminase-like protein [Calocera viscosa TUFC12733]
MASAEDHAHVRFLRLALKEAAKCTPVPTAFCVGCVIVDPAGTGPHIVATGYSRELPGNTHAEANALANLPKHAGHYGLDMYTTLEPCSVRTSGLQPCAEGIVQSGKVKRVFVGVGEPDDFVNCEGAKYLQEHGVEVIWVKDLERECLMEARRGR